MEFSVLRPWLLLLALVLTGCGANTPSPQAISDRLLPLRSNEAIAFLLGDYSTYEVTDNNPAETAERRLKLEEKFDRCLQKAAADHRPPLRTIPTRIVRNYLRQSYGVDALANSSTGIISLLQQSPVNAGIEQTGLRYLAIADIRTSKTGISDSYAAGSQGACIMGIEDESLRHSQVEVQIVSTRGELETGSTTTILSDGKQGGTYGICIFIIIPVPYCIPWWAMTETEACDAFGNAFVSSIVTVD